MKYNLYMTEHQSYELCGPDQTQFQFGFCTVIKILQLCFNSAPSCRIAPTSESVLTCNAQRRLLWNKIKACVRRLCALPSSPPHLSTHWLCPPLFTTDTTLPPPAHPPSTSATPTFCSDKFHSLAPCAADVLHILKLLFSHLF